MPDTRIWDGSAGDNAIATAANWTPANVPISGDSAVFPGMAAASTKDVAGADFNAILLVNLTVEPNCYLNFGSAATKLEFDADHFLYAGRGQSFIDIQNSTDILISSGRSASTGIGYGMVLTGATNTFARLNPGTGSTIGLAPGALDTMTITTMEIASGLVMLGAGFTTTTVSVEGGDTTSYAGCTTLTVRGGLWRQEAGAPTTLNIYGGRVYYDSPDEPTTLNLYGGVLDMSTGGALGKNWSGVTINYYGGSIYDPFKTIPTFTMTRLVGGTINGM